MVNVLKISHLNSTNQLSEKELSSVLGGEGEIPWGEIGKGIVKGGFNLVGGVIGRAATYGSSPKNLTSNDNVGFTNVNANNYSFDSNVRIK